MNKVDPKFLTFLAEGNIICQSKDRTSAEIISSLAGILASHSTGLDPKMIAERVSEREKLMPVLIAPGLAVPHARLPQLDTMLVAMATSREGIAFQNMNGESEKAHVAVMILTPEDEPGLHLQVLTALAKAFAEPGSVDKIAQMNSVSDVMRYFSGASVELPEFLRASDVMDPAPLTLKDNDTLRTAISFFAKNKDDEVPVIDDDGDLRGVISLTDILKYSLPEHILWLDNLKTIDRFQPFAEVLSTADETKLADILREDFIRVSADAPAVQLAKEFLVNQTKQLVVLDHREKLAGIVRLKDFCAKLFWE